jgi:hypothetical protein
MKLSVPPQSDGQELLVLAEVNRAHLPGLSWEMPLPEIKGKLSWSEQDKRSHRQDNDDGDDPQVSTAG